MSETITTTAAELSLNSRRYIDLKHVTLCQLYFGDNTIVTACNIELFVKIVQALLKAGLINNYFCKIDFTPTNIYSSNITPAIWNKYATETPTQFTRIVPRFKHKTIMTWGTTAWGMQYKDSLKLLDIAAYHVEGDSNAVLMFHGTSALHEHDITKGIKWEYGNGACGAGFYLTLNPSEALSYGCTKRRRRQIILLECIVRNADKIRLRYGHATFCPDYTITDAYTRIPNQIAGRDVLLANIQIVRMHKVDAEQLYVTSTIIGNTEIQRPLAPCP